MTLQSRSPQTVPGPGRRTMLQELFGTGDRDG